MQNKPPGSGNSQISPHPMSREITSYTNSAEYQEEERNVDNLTAMMGDLDPNVARRILRKCNGDVQKAATAILEGDRGEAASWSSQITPTPPSLPERKAAQSVIDLTSDDHDDELSRALEASLLPQSMTTFGPSDRAPHPDWAIVPSNASVATSSVSQDDQTLSRVIEESLSTSYNDCVTADYEDQPPEKSVRDGGRPVALHPTMPTLTYAALLIQALFAIPQVRESIARWRPLAPPGATVIDPPTSGREQILWPLVETFANMDLAQLSSLLADDILEVLKAEPWSNATELPGELTQQLLKRIADLIDAPLQQRFDSQAQQELRTRMFFFSYSHISTVPYSPGVHTSEECIVSVVTGGDDLTSNDLVSRLSANLSHYYDNNVSTHDIILEASQVIVFSLKNSRPSASAPAHSSSVAPSSEAYRPFKYPKSLFLDQFLGDNFELANQKRIQQLEMISEIQKLTSRRNGITRFDGVDTLNDLRASLHYYESLADANGDIERQTVIDETALKLKNIISTLEKELEGLDNKVNDLNSRSSVLFDCAELQQHKYDLRAVLMHDGLFGRRQLYSYVKDKGTWWKTIHTNVTEVSEEIVLTDPAGMHLGAGPYLLIYSRTHPEDSDPTEPLPWPEPLKEHIMYRNKEFLASLDPAIAAKAAPFGSPTSSPTTPPVSTSASRQTVKFSDGKAPSEAAETRA